MLVFDDDHLAYWERTKKGALDNLGHDKRVAVMYAGRIVEAGPVAQIFANPNLPDFPGIESFGGQVIHPTQWPDGLDLSD